jgi:hypothetical protein
VDEMEVVSRGSSPERPEFPNVVEERSDFDHKWKKACEATPKKFSGESIFHF